MAVVVLLFGNDESRINRFIEQLPQLHAWRAQPVTALLRAAKRAVDTGLARSPRPRRKLRSARPATATNDPPAA